FASDGNISCFADQLRYETIPARQEMLKRLLIAELNLFGATQDRLRMVERKITEGADVIARQRRLIAEIKNNGGDPNGAERMLRTIETEIARVFVYQETASVCRDEFPLQRSRAGLRRQSGRIWRFRQARSSGVTSTTASSAAATRSLGSQIAHAYLEQNPQSRITESPMRAAADLCRETRSGPRRPRQSLPLL